MERDVHDGTVRDMQRDGKINLFFLRVTNCPSFPRPEGVAVLKPGQSQANGLNLSGTEGFLRMLDF